jgi:hypothetical protein
MSASLFPTIELPNAKAKMEDERTERLRELSWRTRARHAQPRFIEQLPEPLRGSIRFLDLHGTEAHERRFGEIFRANDKEIVADLDERWPQLASLWSPDDEVVLMPAVNQDVGSLVLPFRHLAAHRRTLLDQNHGSLYVSDPDHRRGFSYMAGETENVLVWWPK